MIWKPPRMWEGGRCFILGGGPSALDQFGVPDQVRQRVFAGESPTLYSEFFKPIHGEHVIGVNMAMKIGNWIDVLYFSDAGFWTTHRLSIMAFKGLRVTSSKKSGELLTNERKIKYIPKSSEKYGLSTNPKRLVWNHHSGGAAINLAVHFGVKQIILLGFDMKLDKDANQHWHKYYGSDRKTVKSTFQMHMRGFEQIKIDADKLGVEILNASPDSAIKEFKKISVKEVL